MTSLPSPQPGQKKLGLVIDLDICVGCHACATACKEWNSGGHMAPLPDFDPYGKDAWGVWFNRIHSFEEGEGDGARTVHFPKSCLHCEEPACVTVCPTGASYKRAEDGIVLVNEALCIDRIYNEELGTSERQPACVMVCPVNARHFGDLGDPNSAVSEMVAQRHGADLLPELGYRPVNKYLPPRRDRMPAAQAAAPEPVAEDATPEGGLLRWVDRLLSR
jgi:sulfite dehydrogenase (quinone) subunit SoeB